MWKSVFGSTPKIFVVDFAPASSCIQTPFPGPMSSTTPFAWESRGLTAGAKSDFDAGPNHEKNCANQAWRILDQEVRSEKRFRRARVMVVKGSVASEARRTISGRRSEIGTGLGHGRLIVLVVFGKWEC
jgi:hypothetical protein